jgi:peptidoglycan hydrolase-like protein with peptidoglycan-binding domain
MATRKRKPLEMTQDTDTPPTLAERFPFRHSLDTGDRGVLVMWAQSKLMDSGHYEGDLDGRYDREVTLAVRQFQQDNGLKVTGVIDRRTWEVL